MLFPYRTKFSQSNLSPWKSFPSSPFHRHHLADMGGSVGGSVPTLRPGVKEQYELPKFQSISVDLTVQRVPPYGCIGRTEDGDGQSVVVLRHELCTPAATTCLIREWKHSLCSGWLWGRGPWKKETGVSWSWGVLARLGEEIWFQYNHRGP